MYQLKLVINGVEDVFQSESMQTLVREAAEVFQSKDGNKTLLPFICQVNRKGQIIEMALNNEPADPWWLNNHPVEGGEQVNVSVLIQKINASTAKDCYDVPPEFLSGDGTCWAAVANDHVVDIIYMRIKRSANFGEFRNNAIERLKPKGKIISGMITSNKFFPRTARREQHSYE